MLNRKWFVLFVFSLFLTGCAATGGLFHSQASSPPHPLPMDLGITACDTEISASVVGLIIPGSKESWLKNAPWDEYIVTIENRSDKPFVVLKIYLIDPRSIQIDGTLSPSEIEKVSKVLSNEYKKIGIAVAVTYAPAAIFLTTGSLGVLAFGPLALIAGPAYYFGKTWHDTKNREKVEAEFNRRRFQLPFKQEANSKSSGSVFFPIVPNPKLLVIEYRKDGDDKTLEISLEKLAGLHVAPKESEKKQE